MPSQYIKRLPDVFQTITEKKFFDATFDQVLQKKESDLLYGFLGRRNPGSYQPITDFYLPEPSKNRTWWQLEPTAYAQDADTTKTNIFFYEDLLENIEYYGGNILNQDRLFESQYYSFGPPIDYDMFINYQNYYWVEQGLPNINITGVQGSDIIGKTSYTTPPTATPPNLKLTSGMTISLIDDPLYADPHILQNLGGCAENTTTPDGGVGAGFDLVKKSTDITSGTVFEFLPWDGVIELGNGRLIDNRNWDMTTWEVQSAPSNGDYITIERGALDNNAWSRTNKWYHISAINASIEATNSSFPPNATRALRPIIQFVANIPLYKSGTQFKEVIDFGFRNDSIDQPLTLAQFQGQPVLTINNTYDIELVDQDLVTWFNDPASNTSIWIATINAGIVTFAPFGTPIIEGDIVIVTNDGPYDGAQSGETWYFSNTWQQSFNDKVSTNHPPLFELVDHDGVPLDDTGKYKESSFRGSEIFSYKINTTPGATVDPVLKFPIVYTALGQASDIVFENDLMTDRYTYVSGQNLLPIDGYYYYNITTNKVIYNNWNLYDICDCEDIIPPPPANCVEVSKQRVIDKFVVGYGVAFSFRLSVMPYGYVIGGGPVQPLADILVSVNGHKIDNKDGGFEFFELNNRIWIDLTKYLTNLLITPQSVPPVVEAQTYTHELLNPDYPGYFQIPQQLEANPTQLEVFEISASELTQHFASIIANQIGFEGSAFGGVNNYRDTRKNRSVGSFILQNLAPALKSMLVSSSDDLDFIKGIRFSADEYTKFKNRYLSVALQMINQGFSAAQVHKNEVNISIWVGEIIRRLNISKEFSDAFAYSFMMVQGTPLFSKTYVVPGNSIITLTDYVDLSDPRNILYLYDVTNPATAHILTVGVDYEFLSTNLAIDIQLSPAFAGKTILAALYQNPLPTYIPSTPTKLGLWGAYIPRIELDTSYAIPTNVIIGHDGSKTIAYNDYRDQLLLDLEIRIYNGLQERYRNEYFLPLHIESIKAGFFRKPENFIVRNIRYSRDEFLEITESYLNKWSAKNRANYRINDWLTASLTTPDNQLWKLYNYRLAVNTAVEQTDLPGNWKGIFQYYYDTYYPDTRPWEMLGLSQEPSWWQTEYGNPILNSEGQKVWGSSAAGLHTMYSDLELGIIRHGPSAIYNPNTGEALGQELWKRPGLSTIIPVDGSGEIIPIITLFDLAYTGNPFAPFDHFDDPWIYGDGGPVEQAWMSTSGYAFSAMEFLYLMRPGPFGELFWDTLSTELSPGDIIVGDPNSPQSSTNWQYVQNDLYKAETDLFLGDPCVSETDNLYVWMRPKNKNQIVHAEIINGIPQIRFGYQTWISDRLLFLGKNITDTFGQKIRTLDVNLANKLAGFINKDTTNTYISSVTPGSSANSLIIPSTNFDVFLHKSPSIDTYSYSGIIIRVLADGTFVVYGYDLLNAEFITLDRKNDKLIDVTVGGTPAEFRYFESGATYTIGEIVRYNGVYYESNGTQTVQKFEPAAWSKLKGLPTVGGISVTYKPISAETITRYPYGSIIKTVQEVFDLMIGWGAWLEKQGWQFNEVSPDTNMISDWLSSAKQFLFWLNTSWVPDSSIQLSPLSNSATLIVKRGYPDDVEAISNGVYGILDKYGVAIPPNLTATNRDGPLITVSPSNLSAGGIYYLQINASETEHVIIFDNITNFNDIIYSPLLRLRQQRLRFYGFRSSGWYGKMEAPGYLIIENQLVPNYDTIVDAMRYYYDANITIDNPSLEDLGRHLIGYESKSYLDNLEVTNDVQYLFYQGVIRQKGTKMAFEKLFRSTRIQSNEIIKIFEEWALKLSDFGNTIEQVSTEFKLTPEQNTGEVIVARLNYVPSEIGFVKQINILNAENIYTRIPKIVISEPDASPSLVWTNFNSLASYGIGDIVKLKNALGNSIFYSRKTTGTPGPFNPADWTEIFATRVARAYVVLDKENRISRVGITDPGFGYLSAPNVTIDSGTDSHNLDKLYSVWQGAIISDPTLDNIINIDIDDTAKWVVRPTDPSVALEFPLTDKIEYPLPTAGYVHFNDVNLNIFSVNELVAAWGLPNFNPIGETTIWVANTFTEDWGVYKMLDISVASGFDVIVGAANELLLRTPGPNSSSPYLITPQFGGGSDMSQTDFGNMIGMYIFEAHAITSIITRAATGTTIPVDGQITSVTITDGGTGYDIPPIITVTGDGSGAIVTAVINDGIVTSVDVINGGGGYTTATLIFAPPTDGVGVIKEISITKVGAGYLTPPTVTITGDGSGASATAYVLNGAVSEIVIENGGSGYTNATIEIADPLFVDGAKNYSLAFTFNQDETTNDPLHNYYNLITLTGIPILSTDIPDYASFTNLMIFKTMRFLTEPILNTPLYVVIGDKIWVDGIDLVPPHWNVYNVITPSIAYPKGHKLFRTQEKLINTSLFESATVFNDEGIQLVQLPVYDPFKYILPGRSKQNLSYITLRDPARYNITDNERLFSDTIIFGEDKVGKLWWDLSNTRYVYYEQPKSLASSGEPGFETNTDNLVYRRDRWGQLFPGSVVRIYEWTKSPVPPALYNGSGTPKDTSSYVQISTSNRFTNITETNYYFWVSGTIDRPNIENRTMTAVDVARLLQNPRAQGFAYFSPIQQTETNNSYMFANVQEILAYQGDNIQVQYRISERDDEEHTQWQLFREGDPNSLVTDQFWNKMVDSLVGYTKLLPVSDEWDNGIIIAKNLRWDIFGWDVSPWDEISASDEDADTAEAIYGEILPVPDPTLSEREKYGIEYRPRQGMFINLQAARKVFVQAANELLKHIPIRDNNLGWSNGVTTDEFWTYTTWYEIGYENVVPTVIFQTLQQANLALTTGQLAKDTIVQVLEGTAPPDVIRYVLYAVVQINPNIPLLSFNEVGIENSAIKLLDTVYTTINRYELSVELRQLLNAFRTQVMVDEFIVDQNELFFSMVNYVLSEQKTPDWVFKTSYIVIKEDNIPLTQDQFFIPNQIDNILDYITDVKPYHTHVRNYSAAYTFTDIVPVNGVAADFLKSKIKIKFGPNGSKLITNPYEDLPAVDPMIGWDFHQGQFSAPWDTFNWDVTTLTDVSGQFISRNAVVPNFNPGGGNSWPGFEEETIQVPITFDISKRGYSQLFPYTFSFDDLNINNPQSFITPHNIIAIKTATGILYYGIDYYVEYNELTANYTAYFFNDPGPGPVAFVWVDGGAILNSHIDGYRNELAAGIVDDNLVINVDTRFPSNGDADAYVGWDSGTYDSIDPSTPLGQALISVGFETHLTPDGEVVLPLHWDESLILTILEDVTMSFKHNTNEDHNDFYRNAHAFSGVLVNDLPAPSLESENIDTITIFVDPATHPDGTDILPNPSIDIPGVIWIIGERIEYMEKENDIVPNTWNLKLVRRGTEGTAPTEHLASSIAWIEKGNSIPGIPNRQIWNLDQLPGIPDPATEKAPGEFTSVTNVSDGGLWFANTPAANFLGAKLGKSIP